MPSLGGPSIYVTDPAFIRAKLEAGETPVFIMNIDENLRIIAKPQVSSGAVSVLAYAEFKDADGVFTTDEPAVFSLDDFIEDEIQ